MGQVCCCVWCLQEVFPEAEGGAGAGSGDGMMLLSFEEFKAIVEDYDVSGVMAGMAGVYVGSWEVAVAAASSCSSQHGQQLGVWRNPLRHTLQSLVYVMDTK